MICRNFGTAEAEKSRYQPGTRYGAELDQFHEKFF